MVGLAMGVVEKLKRKEWCFEEVTRANFVNAAKGTRRDIQEYKTKSLTGSQVMGSRI